MPSAMPSAMPICCFSDLALTNPTVECQFSFTLICVKLDSLSTVGCTQMFISDDFAATEKYRTAIKALFL